jgi:hypothetical protein
MTRLTPERTEEILDAYEAWDGTEKVDDFVKRFGTTKQTLYRLLRERGIATKTQTAFKSTPSNGSDETSQVADWLIDRVAQQALRTILEENRQVHRLEERIAALEAYLRAHELDPDDV